MECIQSRKQLKYQVQQQPKVKAGKRINIVHTDYSRPSWLSDPNINEKMSLSSCSVTDHRLHPFNSEQF